MADKQYGLDIIIKAVDQFTAPLRKAVASISSAFSPITDKLKAFGQKAGFGQFGSAVGGVAGAVGNLVGKIALIGTAVAGVAATAGGIFFSLGKEAGDYAGEIDDLTKRFKVSAGAMQEWRYAAEQTGASTEELNSGLESLGKNVGLAIGGKGKAVDVFKGWRIALKNVDGSARSLEDILPELADRFQQVKDPSIAAAAASRLFGGAGLKLLPLLREGKAGLADYAAEAHRLGLVLSDESIAAGDEFGDRLLDLQLVFQGLKNTVGAQFLPVMTELINVFREFIVANLPQITAWAKEFGKALPSRIEAIVKAFQDLGNVLGPVAKVLAWIGDKVGWLNLIFGTLATVIGATLVNSVLTLGGALAKLAVIMVTNPVGLFISALLALGALLYIIWKNWDQISDHFAAKFASVKDAFKEGFIDGIAKLWIEFNPITLIFEAVNGLVKYLTGIDLGKVLGEKFRAAVAAIQQAMPDWLKKLVGLEPLEVSTGGPAGGGGAPLPAGALFAGVPGAPGNNGLPGMGGAGGAAGAAAPSPLVLQQPAAPGAAPAPQQPAAPYLLARPQTTAPSALAQQAATVQAKPQEVKVTVDLNNAPQGTRVETQGTKGTKFDTNIGYSMMQPTG